MDMTATKILQDLLYVRNRFTAETTEQIKGHSVLSRIIDYFRQCSKYEEEQAKTATPAQNNIGGNK